MNKETSAARKKTTPASRSAGSEHLAVSFIRAKSKVSADAQREICSRRAEDLGLHIIEEFRVVSPGASNTAAVKAFFEPLYYLDKNPKISHLVTADCSRLARKGETWAMITKTLNELKVTLTTGTETIHFKHEDSIKEA